MGWWGGSGLFPAQTPGMFMGKSAELLNKAEEWGGGGGGEDQDFSWPKTPGMFMGKSAELLNKAEEWEGRGGGNQDFSWPRHLECSWVNQLSH